MLFRQSFLEGIKNGSITLAFRRWKRPTVKAGGTLLMPVGQLAIVSVTPVTLAQITAARGQTVADFQTLGQAKTLELPYVDLEWRFFLPDETSDIDRSDTGMERDDSERLDSPRTIGRSSIQALELTDKLSYRTIVE